MQCQIEGASRGIDRQGLDLGRCVEDALLHLAGTRRAGRLIICGQGSGRQMQRIVEFRNQRLDAGKVRLPPVLDGVAQVVEEVLAETERVAERFAGERNLRLQQTVASNACKGSELVAEEPEHARRRETAEIE